MLPPELPSQKRDTRVLFTDRLLVDLLSASPEGFFHQSDLDNQRYGVGSRNRAIEKALAAGRIGREGEFLFDTRRLTPEEVRERSALFPGSVPTIDADGIIQGKAIQDRIKERTEQLATINDPDQIDLMVKFRGTAGYLDNEELAPTPAEQQALLSLIGNGFVRRANRVIFDPLRISRHSITQMQRRDKLSPIINEVSKMLLDLPGHTTDRAALIERYGVKTVNELIDAGILAVYSVKLAIGEARWVRLAEADPDIAMHAALEATQPQDADWQPVLETAGSAFRLDVTDAEKADSTFKGQVRARSYRLTEAAVPLGVKFETLESAVDSNLINVFLDPDGQIRVPAYEVETILTDPGLLTPIEDLEQIKIAELQIVLDEANPQVLLSRLRRYKSNVNKTIRWGLLRQSDLFDPLFEKAPTLDGFKQIFRERRQFFEDQLAERKSAERDAREASKSEDRRRRDEERQRREELRARLLAAFPAWKHAGRIDQQVVFHVGPPNSGKTHNALDRLATAGSGWYLAPLRLLAFEIYDRLNRRGVPCNLLTGEERIEIPGATITAATIEMFNPGRSGDCVVIDEAQMLADPDRGWAWTRALMEAQSPEIYVIGPRHVHGLVEKLTTAATIPLEVVEHQRLTPIKVSSSVWSLSSLPERTILVAFSRSMVLRLKSTLEKFNRTVSVVYGNLPPEVRRRQADRFASGETEICVATDAVGMGLNLPADNVCFFEMSKFDGRNTRVLTPSEVHQIGGRAGRFGLSEQGMIGTTNRRDLRTLQALFEMQPQILKKARVAPTVQDLEMIPGSLARRFAQWRELQSIPEELRASVEPADIDERIALAQMLTDRDVKILGLDGAVQIVNAPTRESTRAYWFQCARCIIDQRPMPTPPIAPWQITDQSGLDQTEYSISCADIYLWLALRSEFTGAGPEEESVREQRLAWSMSIDAALVRKVDTSARCVNCGKPLPISHRFAICDECYSNGFSSRSEYGSSSNRSSGGYRNQRHFR